jgi:subtilisin family serine protease
MVQRVAPHVVGILLFFALCSPAFATLSAAKQARNTLALAKQGDAKEQYNLALMYIDGEGVRKDVKEAARWLRLSADQGYARSQLLLSSMYVIGKGVPEDSSEAARFLHLGLAQAAGSTDQSLTATAGYTRGFYEKNHFRNVSVFVLDAGFTSSLSAPGHGTLVRKIIENAVAHEIRIVALDDGPSSTMSHETAVNGLGAIVQYARANVGTRIVVNVSWGTQGADSSVAALVRELLNLNAVIVAAAGNDGKSTCIYPAALPGVIAVASATDSQLGLRRSEYSNWGSCITAAGIVDGPLNLSAGPTDLTSLLEVEGHHGVFESLPNHMIDGSQNSAWGTSFAAPVVAGAIANYLQFHPNSKLTNDDLITASGSNKTLSLLLGKRVPVFSFERYR